jgi:hypothetical protein
VAVVGHSASESTSVRGAIASFSTNETARLSPTRRANYRCFVNRTSEFIRLSRCSRKTMVASKRHKIYIGLGRSPRSLVILLACGGGSHYPRLQGRGPCWFRWPLSQGHRRGSYPVVGGVVHMSRRNIFGWWVTVPAITAWWCCLVSAAWHRDGV